MIPPRVHTKTPRSEDRGYNSPIPRYNFPIPVPVAALFRGRAFSRAIATILPRIAR